MGGRATTGTGASATPVATDVTGAAGEGAAWGAGLGSAMQPMIHHISLEMSDDKSSV